MSKYPEPNRVNLAEWFKDKPFSSPNFVGWRFNAYTSTVAQGCASSVSHSKTRTDKTDSQGQGGPWYETERDALIALYNAKEAEFVKALSEIDARIKKAGKDGL